MSRFILVIHPGGLGDVLLALPALRRLRHRFSEHRAWLVCGGQVGALLKACGEVSEAVSLDRGDLAALLAGQRPSAPGLAGCLAGCDLAVAWLADPDGRLQETLRRFGVRRVMTGSPASPACRAVHQGTRYLEIVGEVETAADEAVLLAVPAAVLAEGRRALSAIRVPDGARWAAIHPGSGSPHKCCDPGVLAQVVGWCRERGLFPVLVGGPADAEAVSAVHRICTNSSAVLAGLDLSAVAGALASAVLFVGHDSGLTHLAARLGLPTIALFGPTESQRWAPPGPHVAVLTGEPCACRDWESVRACDSKPCLRISLEALTVACEARLRDAGARI